MKKTRLSLADQAVQKFAGNIEQTNEEFECNCLKYLDDNHAEAPDYAELNQMLKIKCQ